MELKTYQASSMAEALEKVKKDLGRSAVILHTRTLKKGGVMGVGSRTVVEITASRDVGALPSTERKSIIGHSDSRPLGPRTGTGDRLSELGSLANKENAVELAKTLEGFVLEVTEDANEEGHLYGSVNAKRIAEELGRNKIKIKEDLINLPEPIKTVGEHEIEIELRPEVKTKIKIKISPAAI